MDSQDSVATEAVSMLRKETDSTEQLVQTNSPKGNDPHLRAIIQSEKKCKHQFFRRLRAGS